MGSAGANVVFEVRKGAALVNGLAQWLCQGTSQVKNLKVINITGVIASCEVSLLDSIFGGPYSRDATTYSAASN